MSHQRRGNQIFKQFTFHLEQLHWNLVLVVVFDIRSVSTLVSLIGDSLKSSIRQNYLILSHHTTSWITSLGGSIHHSSIVIIYTVLVTVGRPFVGGDWCLVEGDWCLVGEGWCLVGRDWSLIGEGWSLVGGSWRLVGGDWSLVGGSWCLVGGDWSLVGGSWCLVRGDWSLVGGSWCLVGGDWCLVWSLSVVWVLWRVGGLCVCSERRMVSLARSWVAVISSHQDHNQRKNREQSLLNTLYYHKEFQSIRCYFHETHKIILMSLTWQSVMDLTEVEDYVIRLLYLHVDMIMSWCWLTFLHIVPPFIPFSHIVSEE